MLKKWIRQAFTLLLVCVILSGALPVLAAPEEQQLLTNVKEGEVLTVVISFDKEMPEVVLISPDGTSLEVTDGNEAIKLAVYDTWAMVQVTQPAAGDWYIAVDKKSNTEVSWQLVETVDNIWIQYIRVEPNTDGTVKVTFLAEQGTQKRSYDYELSLTTADGSGSMVVKTGRGTTGEEESLRLDLRDYTSFEAYILRMNVTMEADGITLYDEYDSEPFAFQNPDTPEAPSGIDLQVDGETRELVFNWKNYKQYRFDSYYLEVFADGEDVPIYYSELQKDDDRISIFVEEGKDRLTVKFYGRKDKLLSAPVVRSVTLGDQSCLQILTPNPTASGQAQIRMDLPDTVELQVSVGETVTTFTSSGKEDTVAVDIASGVNLVVAEATVDGVCYRAEKRIYKDSVPPVLTFFESYDETSHSTAQIVLVGNADNATSLLLNNKKIELDAYGNFSVTVDLQPGENVAEFVAEDAVGNRTSRTIRLYGPEAQNAAAQTADDGKVGLLDLLPLLICLALSVLAIAGALILMVRRKKLKGFSFIAMVCVLVALLGGAVVGLVNAVLEKNALEKTANSMELSDMADRSLPEAAQLMEALEAAPGKVTTWIWLTVAAAVLLLAAIAFGIWRNRRGKAEKETPAQQPLPEVVLQEPESNEENSEE